MASTIDPVFKGTVQAAPPVDRDETHLLPEFRTKLDATLQALASAGTPFKLVEGFRTVDRQQWLYGSGRPGVTPYGRPGKIVTKDDGVNHRSNHQGDGTVGSGTAADCYPMVDGSVTMPAADDPIWRTYADAAVAQGLEAGLDWKRFVDAPHCQLPKP